MILKNKITFISLISLCSLLFAIHSTNVFANARWILLQSKSGAYKVKIPDQYKRSEETLRITPEAIAYTENLRALIDFKPYKDVVNHFSVKIDQTFGLPFSRQEAKEIVDYDLLRYTQIYKKRGATIKQSTRTSPSGAFINELFINYEDPEFGPQNIRIAIFTSDVTKYIQTFIGQGTSVFNLKIDSFFKEIRIAKGIAKSKGSFKDEWNKYVSPHNIFTAYFPPATKKFGNGRPKIVHNRHNERMSYTFIDPARGETLIYKISGYSTNKPLKAAHMRQVLMKRHVQNYQRVLDKVNFQNIQKPDGTLVVKADVYIIPTEKRPYADIVNLSAEASGRHMIVHEFSGSRKLVLSHFVQSLKELTHFHPEKFGEPRITEKEKPKDETASEGQPEAEIDKKEESAL